MYYCRIELQIYTLGLSQGVNDKMDKAGGGGGGGVLPCI